jgi:hypothetical protein
MEVGCGHKVAAHARCDAGRWQETGGQNGRGVCNVRVNGPLAVLNPPWEAVNSTAP